MLALPGEGEKWLEDIPTLSNYPETTAPLPRPNGSVSGVVTFSSSSSSYCDAASPIGGSTAVKLEAGPLSSLPLVTPGGEGPLAPSGADVAVVTVVAVVAVVAVVVMGVPCPSSHRSLLLQLWC